jgi:hypothetical protein
MTTKYCGHNAYAWYRGEDEQACADIVLGINSCAQCLGARTSDYCQLKLPSHRTGSCSNPIIKTPPDGEVFIMVAQVYSNWNQLNQEFIHWQSLMGKY